MGIPSQRQPGQRGGGGRINHSSSRVKSSNRGGRPHSGGGGSGKKPPGDGCAVVALALMGGLATGGAGVIYGVYKGIEAML